MQIVLFDDALAGKLLPFTFTRPVCEIRCGITTIREKWEYYFPEIEIRFLTFRTVLQFKWSAPKENTDTLFINGALFPNEDVLSQIRNLAFGTGLKMESGRLGAFRSNSFNDSTHLSWGILENCRFLTLPEDIFQQLGVAIQEDFERLTVNRESEGHLEHVTIIGSHPVFLEKSASIKASVINAEAGPVYLAADSEIMEGCLVRGPFALGEHSALKMGAKVYGPTVLGPHCKAGGELNNSILMGYSNKAHDGFLGNSVIGEWCNLGADTNNSNLKNNYDVVKLWDHETERFRSTGLQFCGLMMADHSKAGINTMFNTGTVVGVGANIFGAGFPRNFLPSFAWGGAQGFETFRFPKFIETANRVLSRRGLKLSEAEVAILESVYQETSTQRTWENTAS